MEMEEKTMTHLKEHLPEMPATGREILGACESMSDIPEMDAKMITAKLDPERTYNSPEEVMEDLEIAMPKKKMEEEM